VEELLLKGDQVAKALNLGRSKVYQLMAQGQAGGGLPVIRIGKSVRVPARALEEWVERQAREAEQVTEAV
jgi:excisionase family DNA binding protein